MRGDYDQLCDGGQPVVGQPARQHCCGDLLIVFLRSAANVTIQAAWPAANGWTRIVATDSADASDDITNVMYRWADGTETSPLSVFPWALLRP